MLGRGLLYDLLPGEKQIIGFTQAQGANFHCQPTGRQLTHTQMLDWLADHLPARQGSGCLPGQTTPRWFSGMKSLTLILAFLPLIVFSVLARFLPHGDIGIAGLAAAVVALVAIVTSHPIWPPKILNTCSLVLFTVTAILGFTLGKNDDRWLATWGGAGVGIILGLIILVLVPVMPFTEQFARETVPQAEWSSPTFKKINRVLSAAWGVAIFAIGLARVAAAAIDRHNPHRLLELLLSLGVPLAIIVYMLKFSTSYPDRVAHEPPGAPAGP